jgi:hypothetical protein
VPVAGAACESDRAGSCARTVALQVTSRTTLSRLQRSLRVGWELQRIRLMLASFDFEHSSRKLFVAQ